MILVSEDTSSFLFWISVPKENTLTALRKVKYLPPVPSTTHNRCWRERPRIATCNESDGLFANVEYLRSPYSVKLPN